MRSNTQPGDLLPYDIITYGCIRHHAAPVATTTSSHITSTTNMELHPLQNLLNTAALKELPKFTGDPNQKVTQFINAVEHIGSFAGLNESMLHSITIIKLGGSAFSWYDNNKEDLKS